MYNGEGMGKIVYFVYTYRRVEPAMRGFARVYISRGLLRIVSSSSGVGGGGTPVVNLLPKTVSGDCAPITNKDVPVRTLG